MPLSLPLLLGACPLLGSVSREVVSHFPSALDPLASQISSVDEHRDEHLVGGQRAVQPDQGRLVGEVAVETDRAVAAGRRPRRRRAGAARAASTGPNQPRPIASSRVSTSARSPRNSRQVASDVVDRAAAAVEVAEPRLATEQRRRRRAARVARRRRCGARRASRPCRGRRPRPAGPRRGSASRSCSASASIIASCWSHWAGGDAVAVAGPVEVAVVEVGQRRAVAPTPRPRPRSARRPGRRRRTRRRGARRP